VIKLKVRWCTKWLTQCIEVDEDEDASSSSSSSSDDSNDDSTPSKKRNHVAPELTCDISDEEEDFDAEAFVTECQAKPLPRNAVFRWVKVRTVTVSPQWDDKGNLTGKYTLLCDCGFQKRIGVCCRHSLAVLFLMVLENVRSAEEGSDDSDSTGNEDESAYADPTSIDWSAYPGILQGLCNMNLCSKIKYHAALHQKGHLFQRELQPFKPTVPKGVPLKYIQNFEPDKDQLQRIPTNGMPQDPDDIDVPTEVEFFVNASATFVLFFTSFQDQTHHKPPVTAKSNDRDQRDREPTFFNCSSLLESNWKFTSRLDKNDRVKARKRIKKILFEMDEELRAMATCTVPEKNLTRRLSARDMFLGKKR
jgi:hypothetical protein